MALPRNIRQSFRTFRARKLRPTIPDAAVEPLRPAVLDVPAFSPDRESEKAKSSDASNVPPVPESLLDTDAAETDETFPYADAGHPYGSLTSPDLG